MLSSMSTGIIFEFEKEVNIEDWIVVDDVVMGGRSLGEFSVNSDGFGVFEGRISLENNGGFSSLRYRFDNIEVNNESSILLSLKGDGKQYQFRVKDSQDTYYSYIGYFETNGEWQEISISLKDLFPSWRGRKLNKPNFSHPTIEEIAFLIGNKKAETFKLLIKKIELR